MEEADMMNMQLPSRRCFHDYPVWEYNLIRRVQRLRREAEKQNGSNA